MPALQEGTAALENQMRLLSPVGAQLVARDRARSIGSASTVSDDEAILEIFNAAKDSSSNSYQGLSN